MRHLSDEKLSDRFVVDVESWHFSIWDWWDSMGMSSRSPWNLVGHFEITPSTRGTFGVVGSAVADNHSKWFVGRLVFNFYALGTGTQKQVCIKKWTLFFIGIALYHMAVTCCLRLDVGWLPGGLLRKKMTGVCGPGFCNHTPLATRAKIVPLATENGSKSSPWQKEMPLTTFEAILHEICLY